MMQTKLFRAAGLGAVSLLTATSAQMLAPSISCAAQFVLFDVTFTFTKMDADTSTPSKSHYYVRGAALNPDRPIDWTTPVDYRNGTVHIRTEVIEKPAGSENTEWTLCYIPNRGQGNGYGCTGTGIYREKGVYERDVPMTSFWENESIVWPQGIKQMDLVIKDGSGGRGHAHRRPDSEKFFPTKMRITMVQVSAGSTYDPGVVPNLRAGAGLTRQMVLPVSSATSRAPELSTATPTGRPFVLPVFASARKPVRKSSTGAVGRPLRNGTKMTLYPER